MIYLISLTAPIFILIGCGFLARKTELLDKQHISGLAAFVLNIALPALILHAMVSQPISETLNWHYLLAYGGGSLSVLVIIIVLYRYILQRGLTLSAIVALGSAASNSAFMGFPIAVLLIGDGALAALPMTFLVENVLIIPLALVLAEGAGRRKSRTAMIKLAAQQVVKTPLIVAIVVGLLIVIVDFELPNGLLTALSMLAAASAPCALIVVGGTLSGMTTTNLVTPNVSVIVLGKLIFHPMAIAGCFLLFGNVSSDIHLAGLIFASMPMLTIYPIIGQKFGQDNMSAAALLVATILSVFSISLALLTFSTWFEISL